MAEEKNNKPEKRISEKQRFSYIGFEVFPGEPKNLFKSDSEKKKLEDINRSKREQGQVLRENCTLLEERVSIGDRIVMTVASAAIILALFLPWYSVYNVIEEETLVEEPIALVDSLETATDSLAMVENDSAVVATTDDSLTAAASTSVDDQAETQPVVAAPKERAGVLTTTNEAGEEVLINLQVRKKINKEYSVLSGVGAFTALGSVGGMVFSSGIILMLTAMIFMIYTLLCLGLPAYTMYAIYGSKGSEDDKALALKKIVSYSWIPVIMFFVAFFFSFFGADYGFNSVEYFTSLGSNYDAGVFLGTISWGVFVSLGGFVLIAVKGSEI